MNSEQLEELYSHLNRIEAEIMELKSLEQERNRNVRLIAKRQLLERIYHLQDSLNNIKKIVIEEV